MRKSIRQEVSAY